MSVWLDNEFASQYANDNLELFEWTRQVLDFAFKKIPKDASILEFGCNIGVNLEYLKQKGFTNLSGYDINPEIIKRARKNKGITFYDKLPKEKFEIVFVFGVLIHIKPKKHLQTMSEIYNLAEKQIIGLEYYSDKQKSILWRNLKDECFSNDFAKKWDKYFVFKNGYGFIKEYEKTPYQFYSLTKPVDSTL